MVFAENNYLPFLPKLYKSQRKNFFEFTEITRPKSSSTDKSLENAIEFIIANKHRRTEKILVVKNVMKAGKNYEKPLVDLSWIPDKWWKSVTGSSKKNKKIREVNRIFFEICLFSIVMQELNSGDLYIECSDKYGDYSKQFASWLEFQELIIPFMKQIGLPTNIDQIGAELKKSLSKSVRSTDNSFPLNETVSVKNGELVIRKIPKKKEPEGFNLINRKLNERMPDLNLIDILSDTEHWINWTSSFRPISGYETRIDSSQEKYIKTTFCYGCYMGPTQTERSFDEINRKQLAYLNRRHIDEEKLQQAIVKTINKYNQFKLPKVWGHGKSASADGTKWNMYQRNLLSEYHIRYGGWGGIGYYHVSDRYIALFSHFIPCGVYEAVYILDGLLKNKSEIQPDTLHADTHGQSAVVFGLAYLLGIKLMPRIKNWKNLKFFLPKKKMPLKNIGLLFSDTINWRLIEKYMPDMLRVALSISKGKLAPSTILRKLGTQSRKNKLYFAFRELGRVVRTIYLLEYLSDEELRKTIRAATIKSEEWNSFIDWIAFGGLGVITENVRDEQRKIIKYNHLVANLTILHNVQTMTKILNDLKNEGYTITDEIASHFAPYRNGHINRFGKIDLKFDHIPEPLAPNIDFSMITED
jgi:TnpA family transposase